MDCDLEHLDVFVLVTVNSPHALSIWYRRYRFCLQIGAISD